MQTIQKGSASRFRANAPIVLSAWAFLALWATSPARIAVVVLCAVAVVVAGFFCTPKKVSLGKGHSVAVIIALICLLIVLGVSAFEAFATTNKAVALAATMGISVNVLVAVLVTICALLAWPFCTYAATLLEEPAVSSRLAGFLESRQLRLGVYALAGLGALLTVISSFNGYIWADESYSLVITTYSYLEIVEACAGDVHPPFYYLALKAAEDIASLFGADIFAKIVVGKFFSVLPYVLLAWLLFVKLADSKARPFVILALFSVPNLMDFAVEIRMYSWGLLFVTAAFLFARDIILGKRSPKTWACLVFFSVLGSYTHTFALVSVAGVWFWLVLWCLVKDRGILLRCFICGCVVLACFFPWLLVLLRQVGYVSESYWIQPMTLSDLFSYITYVLPSLALLVPVAVIAGGKGKLSLRNRVGFADGMGILVPLFTLAVGITVSFLVRPVFMIRYIVPALMCMWVALLLLTEKATPRAQALIATLLVVMACSSYYSFAKSEAQAKSYAQDVMEFVDGLEDDAVIVVSHSHHIADTIATLTDKQIYEWNAAEPGTTQTSAYRLAYRNLHAFDDEEQLSAWLARGVPVYYLEEYGSAPEDTIQESATRSLESFGEYNISYLYTIAYRIIAT